MRDLSLSGATFTLTLAWHCIASNQHQGRVHDIEHVECRRRVHRRDRGAAGRCPDAALRDSASAGLPAIAVSAAQGKLLMLLARAIRRAPSSRSAPWVDTVRSGWHGGWPKVGRLITLEADARHAMSRAPISVGPASEHRSTSYRARDRDIAATRGHPRSPFDLVFIDADKPGIPG